jgi:hypothetical protein
MTDQDGIAKYGLYVYSKIYSTTITTQIINYCIVDQAYWGCMSPLSPHKNTIPVNSTPIFCNNIIAQCRTAEIDEYTTAITGSLIQLEAVTIQCSVTFNQVNPTSISSGIGNHGIL